METRRSGLDELDFAYGVGKHKEHCRQLIVANRFTTVREIGGGRSPLFSRDQAIALGLDYTILDISDTELQAAPDHVKKIVADIGALDVKDFPARYDFMFSRMLAEHVSDGTAMHKNVLHLLRPGGMVFHFFPTLFTPAFVANWLLPERAARRVLFFLFPWRRKDSTAKFPARYSKGFWPPPLINPLF